MSERHPVQSIIPPYMLEAVAANGTAEQRAWAAASLQATAAVAALRAAAPPLAPGVSADLVSTATRTIYDAKTTTSLPGTLVRNEGDPAGSDVAVNEAYDGLGATLQLYGDIYSRNSIDGAGLDLIATVHFGSKYDNAQWNGSQMLFGDGDGTLFNRFTISIDVMGHELTHGVTQYSGGMDYQDQSGALNESISDVFGSLVKQYHASPRQTADQADWLIGAGLLASGVNGVALRSMKAPGTAYDDPVLGKDPQPSTMAGYVNTTSDNGGVHTNSGIPNHAFYLAAIGFGGFAWEKAGRIWYETLIESGRPSNISFADFAQRTVDKAKEIFDYGAAFVVRDAWHQVGIDTFLSGWAVDWFPLPGQAVFDREHQKVAAVSRASGNLDLFVIGNDSHIWSTYWNDQNGWAPDWFPLPGQAVFDREHQQIAAVTRASGNLDLFVLGFDDHGWSTYWNAG